MPNSMKIDIKEDFIILQREQWKGNIAYISNYPGLLEEVSKYTWTYSEGDHPYLNCSKLHISLHKFVLQFLYGKDKLDQMLGKSNIIEHLDNNGLNCSYENLHILSHDDNIAKAFSIDKKRKALQAGELSAIPTLITDVYYSHINKYFQLQVFFNKNIIINKSTNQIVEAFLFHYNDFDDLFMDWLYCYKCMENEKFDITKHHADRIYASYAPLIELKEDEKNSVFIERDGSVYLLLQTKPENGPLAFINHMSFQRIDKI